MNSGDLGIVHLTVAIALFAVLWAAGLALARRWIMEDLQKRGHQPLVVGWRAFAFKPIFGPTFRALYADQTGVVHSADCCLRGWHFPVVYMKTRVLGGD